MPQTHDPPPDDDDIPTDPDRALEACREAGLVEGQWCYDARARYVRIESLSPNAVIFVTETGQTTAMNSPVELYRSYCQDDLYPITDDP